MQIFFRRPEIFFEQEEQRQLINDPKLEKAPLCPHKMPGEIFFFFLN